MARKTEKERTSAGQLIREFRLFLKLSQVDFGQKYGGVSQQAVTHWELTGILKRRVARQMLKDAKEAGFEKLTASALIGIDVD